jgi:hypothetical protein
VLVKILARTALLLSLCLSQCSLGPSASQKAEAGRLSRAIDVLREAPNAQKAAFFSQLQSASCETPELCELRRLCAAGYAQHLDGLSQTARAKALLADGGTQAEAQASLALDAARAALSEAEPQIARCADAQGAAHRKYKF